MSSAIAAKKNNQLSLYKPHKKQALFHKLGATARQRLFLAGNRTGKTFSGCMETTYHLTGLYPDWWEGKRFKKPVAAWAATDSTEATRDILQVTYMGGIMDEDFGTGTIPKDCIEGYTRRQGIANALDTVRVKHVSGGYSELTFKSYEQGRNKFQGTKRQVIHLDEEPPFDIYSECMIRLTAAAGSEEGIMLLTMTPLSGMTDMVRYFWDSEAEGVVEKGRVLVMASWMDADHLSDKEKQQLEDQTPDHQKEARAKGIPSIGEGMVYPIAESQILVERFPIPDHFKQFYAMDFGWNPDPTVALFFAYDPEKDILYITKEYSQKERTPKSHAEYINQLGGDWMQGVVDPYGGTQAGQSDGKSMVQRYKEAGLRIRAADRSYKQNGIILILEMMREGRLKVFDDLAGWLSEFRMYAYDDKGKPKDKNDHFMDTMRYGVESGMKVAKSKRGIARRFWDDFTTDKGSWETV